MYISMASQCIIWKLTADSIELTSSRRIAPQGMKKSPTPKGVGEICLG